MQQPVTRLRVKVTNKCNLNCIFCHREGSSESTDLLTADDYRFIAETCHKIGIRRFKITGGEPLLRRDIIDIVKVFAAFSNDISVSTNGVLLDEYLYKLRSAGLHRLNISIHTLDRGKYKFITGNDVLDRVVSNIVEASHAGFKQVKVNVVVMKINVDEIWSFIRFCKRHSLTLQLIELMPLGLSHEMFSRLHVPLNLVLEKIKKRAQKFEFRQDLHNRPVLHVDGVAIEFVMGFNNPEFCKACRQIRLTSDGKLRGCLYRPLEIDVLEAIKRRDFDKFTNALFKLREMWTPMWSKAIVREFQA